MSGAADATARGRLGLLQTGVFFSAFDRLVIAPLLLVIADDLDVSVAAVTTMATVYFIGYGLMQVTWGIVSDHLGRVRTVRLALLLAAAASLATVVAPSLAVLVGIRLVAGGAYAAVVPGALIYIGDTVPAERRHGPVTDVMTATALGTAAGTMVGAFIAELVSWRAAFAVPGALVLVLVVLLGRVPEPPHTARRPGSVLAPLLHVLRQRWALVVIGFALLEGATLLGILTYLPTVLQTGGMSTTLSGTVTAGYGLAIVVFARLVKHVSARLGPTRLIGVGAVVGPLAYVVLILDQGVAGVLTAAFLFAAAWAFMHSTMQNWATQVVPEARASTVSLFASSLFLGSALGTALGAPFVAAERYVPYFAVALGITVVLAGTAVLARSRYVQG